jgi:tetratricopeptide (TPR) repeat protein
MTVAQAMQTASEHHRAGRFDQAESIYRAILARYPDDPGAIHQLGVLQGQRGLNDEGIALIRRAIQLVPDFHDAYSNLGFLLGGTRRFDEAQAAFSKALELKPDFFEPVLGIGKILAAKGKVDEAIAQFVLAAELRPAYLLPHLELAELLLIQNRLDEALASFRRAIEIDPNSARAHFGMGNALISQLKFDAAIAALQRAIQIEPSHGPCHNNLAHALAETGRLSEAVAIYRQALKLLPDSPEVLASLGNALTLNREFEEAIVVCRRAIQIKPELAQAHSNLGNALIDKGELEEAQASFHLALQLNPDYSEAYNNLGNALFWSGKFEPAAAAFRRASELRPDLPDGPWNLANCLLLNGDFENGLPLYEWRWKIKTMSAPRPFHQPQWAGEELSGRTILLHAEQGLGDILQFIRYVPLVIGRGGQVILECPSTLIRLFSQLPNIREIVVTGAPLPHFDVHCPLMTLPLAFKTDLNSIPASIPYLAADAALSEPWKERLDSDNRGRRTGLVWAGASRHTNDRNRSIRLSQFAPLASVPNAVFFSLQKGDAAKQTPPPGMIWRDFTADIADFADTAALLENLDLVITVDTSVAHLAGAMGKPVWLLLPFVPDWRWFLLREDSPWYPTMRLFRQATRGDWADVMNRVSEALKEFYDNSL